jgi:hypothetical protein
MPNPVGPPDEAKIREMAKEYTGGRDDRLCVLAEDEDGPYAILCGFATPVFYTNAYQAYEIVWWAVPGKRDRNVLRLFDVYEAWAKQIGCASIQTSYLHDWMDMTRFFERRGFTKTETSFRKAI